jgi:hypothetical protein
MSRNRKGKNNQSHSQPAQRLADQLFHADTLFGHSRVLNEFEVTVGMPTDHLVCMAVRLDPPKADDLIRHIGIECSPGQWIVSSGRCHDLTIHGPFDSVEEALAYGVERLGVACWVSEPCFYPFSTNE